MEVEEEKDKIKVVYTTREDFERTFGKQLKKLDPDDNENDVWIFVVLPHTLVDILPVEKFASLFSDYLECPPLF